jgi:uncharacterized membrane protein YccC
MIENLSFSSTVFRHSLRLTITILIGFIIGKAFPFKMPIGSFCCYYETRIWLNKTTHLSQNFRNNSRCLYCFGILFLVHDSTIIGGLAIIALLFGFSFTPTNYKVGATFITIYVIFIYGILAPDIDNLIQYRVVDTLVGALLSF